MLWRDTPASFAGEHYRFRDVYFEPKAFRPEGPQLWLGGAGLHRRMLERIVGLRRRVQPARPPRAGGDGTALAPRCARLAGTCAAWNWSAVPAPSSPARTAVADLGQALATIPPQAEAGFTTFCIKPSQFTDDPAEVGRLCREIIRRVDGMLP